MSNYLQTAREVIELEIQGLKSLQAGLGRNFIDVTELLRTAKGRIVVTGMGKSGHVARKIASTFSSTGTPSMFVHPGEASHGDLGMIAPTDVILALSKSGETTELGDLLAYAARFSIPVAAITGASGSTLAKAADAILLIAPAQEACGETRAPTTSTTMMMAAGDALAIALLRDKGFTSNDFKGFHPGGNLGAALRRVTDLMHGADELPLLNTGAPMPDVVDAISKGGFGCVGLTSDNGQLQGIITDGDLRRRYSTDISQKTAGEIMTENPMTVTQDTLAGDVLALLSREKITALFVVKDGRPIGIVHVHDCLSVGVL